MNYSHKALAAVVATLAACAFAVSPASAAIEITDAHTGEICGDPVFSGGQVSGGCELIAEADDFSYSWTGGGGACWDVESRISLHVGTSGEILSDDYSDLAGASNCSPYLSTGCDDGALREGQIRETGTGLEADLEMCISPWYDMQGTVTFGLTGEGYEGYIGPSWTFTADNAPMGAYAHLTGAWVTEPPPGGHGAFLAVY